MFLPILSDLKEKQKHPCINSQLISVSWECSGKSSETPVQVTQTKCQVNKICYVWLSSTDKYREKSQMLVKGQLMLEVYSRHWVFLKIFRGFQPKWDIITTYISHLKHTHIIPLHTHTAVVSAEACSAFSQSGCGIVVPCWKYLSRRLEESRERVHPLAAVLSLQTMTDIILFEVSIQTNGFKLCSCWCYRWHSFSVKSRPASPQAGQMLHTT